MPHFLEPEESPAQQCCVDVSFLQALTETRAGLDRNELHKVVNILPPGITILGPPDCRICLDVGDGDSALVQPCSCLGSLSFTHISCLDRWVAARGRLSCELCGQPYKEQVLLQLTQSTVKAAAAASERAKAQQGAAETRQRTEGMKMIKVLIWIGIAVFIGFVVVVGAVAKHSRSPDAAVDTPGWR